MHRLSAFISRDPLSPMEAIIRVKLHGDGYEYRVNPELFIGCGFCAGVCSCGIWALVSNVPYNF